MQRLIDYLAILFTERDPNRANTRSVRNCLILIQNIEVHFRSLGKHIPLHILATTLNIFSKILTLKRSDHAFMIAIKIGSSDLVFESNVVIPCPLFNLFAVSVISCDLYIHTSPSKSFDAGL